MCSLDRFPIAVPVNCSAKCTPLITEQTGWENFTRESGEALVARHQRLKKAARAAKLTLDTTTLPEPERLTRWRLFLKKLGPGGKELKMLQDYMKKERIIYPTDKSVMGAIAEQSQGKVIWGKPQVDAKGVVRSACEVKPEKSPNAEDSSPMATKNAWIRQISEVKQKVAPLKRRSDENLTSPSRPGGDRYKGK